MDGADPHTGQTSADESKHSLSNRRRSNKFMGVCAYVRTDDTDAFYIHRNSRYCDKFSRELHFFSILSRRARVSRRATRTRGLAAPNTESVELPLSAAGLVVRAQIGLQAIYCGWIPRTRYRRHAQGTQVLARRCGLLFLCRELKVVHYTREGDLQTRSE